MIRSVPKNELLHRPIAVVPGNHGLQVVRVERDPSVEQVNICRDLLRIELILLHKLFPVCSAHLRYSPLPLVAHGLHFFLQSFDLRIERPIDIFCRIVFPAGLQIPHIRGCLANLPPCFLHTIRNFLVKLLFCHLLNTSIFNLKQIATFTVHRAAFAAFYTPKRADPRLVFPAHDPADPAVIKHAVRLAWPHFAERAAPSLLALASEHPCPPVLLRLGRLAQAALRHSPGRRCDLHLIFDPVSTESPEPLPGLWISFPVIHIPPISGFFPEKLFL